MTAVAPNDLQLSQQIGRALGGADGEHYRARIEVRRAWLHQPFLFQTFDLALFEPGFLRHFADTLSRFQ